MVKLFCRPASDKWKHILSAILMLISLLTAGCWDARELQDKSFVTAVAVDLADEGKKEAEKPILRLESYEQQHPYRQYRLSLQIVKLNPSKQEGGPSEPSKTFTISNTGQSMLKMIRDMLGQSSKGLYFEHLDAIIISEAAVRQNGLRAVLDLFIRDAEMRRRIKIFITPGEARKLLEYQPPSGETLGRFLAGLIENHKRNLHFGGARTDLGYTIQALDNGYDPMIPRIELADDVIKVFGLAAFHNDRFIYYLNEYAMQGLKHISGTPKNGAIQISCPEHPWSVIVFEMFQHETILRPHVDKDGKIYFTLDITMWGNIDEVLCAKDHKVEDPEFLRRMEILVAEQVKQNCLFTLRELQQNKVDLPRLGGKVKVYLPKEWKKVKERWDEVYPTVPFQVSVNVIIRGVGEHN